MSKIFTINDSNLGDLTVHYEDGTVDNSVFEHLLKQKVVGWDSETTWDNQNEGDYSAGVDPYRSRIRLSQFATENGDIYIFDHFKIPSEDKEKLTHLLTSVLPVKVAHNAKFDVKMARKHLSVQHLGKIFCTELGYRLTKCGLYKAGKVSLLDAVMEMLGFSLKKDMQLSDWSLPELSEEQLMYSAIDAFVVIPLRQELLKKIKELKIEYATKLDFDIIDPISDLELNGFPINPEKWIEVDTQTRQKRMELIEQINDQLRDKGVIAQQGLFPGAPLESTRATKGAKLKKQTLAVASSDKIGRILEDYGITLPEKIDRKTRKKSKTTGTPFLKPLSKKYEIIPLLLKFRELEKRKTSYGKNYIDKYVHPLTGRIHADFDPQGTLTARFACNKPNLQQIPRLAEYRSCFQAPEGWSFVGGDFSQIELRIAAELSKEAGYIEAFLSGKDFHDATTVVMFNVPPPPDFSSPEEKDAWLKNTEEGKHFSKMRSYAKNINFGIIYGMGAGKLALSTGLPENKNTLRVELLVKYGILSQEEVDSMVKEMVETGYKPWEIYKSFIEYSNRTIEQEVEETKTAQDYLDKYYESFPDLMEWLRNQGKSTAMYKQSRMASGRLVKFYVGEEKWQIAQAERNGMNTPIQGLAGEILKIALRSVFDRIYNAELQDNIKLTHTVHDEIQLLAKDEVKDIAKRLLHESMIEAGEIFLKAVPTKVDIKISKVWEK
jgi:DNA polymerase I